MMSSEEYEVLYTLRSELAKKGVNPGVFGAPWRLGPGGPGFGGRQGWGKNITPAEMGVLMKYREKGRQRAVVGGILGASAMAGVWKVAALGGFMGVAGVMLGGVIGARVSLRTSGIRREIHRNA